MIALSISEQFCDLLCARGTVLRRTARKVDRSSKEKLHYSYATRRSTIGLDELRSKSVSLNKSRKEQGGDVSWQTPISFLNGRAFTGRLLRINRRACGL